VGANDHATADVVVEDLRRGGGQRHGLGAGHNVGDGGNVHKSRAGDNDGHALDDVVGGDDNVAADVVVDDRQQGGGNRQGRGGGRVGRDGALVRAGPNADAAADIAVDDQPHGGGKSQGRGGGHVGVDRRLVNPRHAGYAGANALGHGAGDNDDAAADVVVDDRRHCSGQRHVCTDSRVGGDGGLVGADDDAAADVVMDDRRRGGGARHGCGEGHVAGDGGHVHQSRAGYDDGHARDHGVGANVDATVDVVVEDSGQGGGNRRGCGGGRVGVDGGHVHQSRAGDNDGQALDDVVGGDDNAAADVVADDR